MPTIIAVDIDDVLSENAAGFIAYTNKTWGHSLITDDYDENWARLWGVDHEEAARRVEQFHAEGVMRDYGHISVAIPVLQKLAKTHKLVVVTSRHQAVRQLTIDWINKHFPGIFSDIYFAGLYDSGTSLGAAYNATKADVLVKIGASYLIDDQLKHCNAAAEQGIKAIVFGSYPWNTQEKIHDAVERCDSWKEVEHYFYGKS